jgi:hypothetical protein
MGGQITYSFVLIVTAEEVSSNLGFLIILLLQSKMVSVCGRFIRSMFKIKMNDDTNRENSFRTGRKRIDKHLELYFVLLLSICNTHKTETNEFYLKILF